MVRLQEVTQDKSSKPQLTWEWRHGENPPEKIHHICIRTNSLLLLLLLSPGC
jgi:hypothetical protein